MSADRYHLQQSKLANLKKDLDADPTSIEAAKRYWIELASFGSHDVRKRQICDRSIPWVRFSFSC